MAHRKVVGFGTVVLSLVLAVANALAAGVNPQTVGDLAALVRDDHMVVLKNQRITAVFDPADAGAASSIAYAPIGHELAVCQTYRQAHFKAFRESFYPKEMREARLNSTTGQPYTLTALGVADGAAFATFEGYPHADLPSALKRVKVTKTYTLRAGVDRIDVSLHAVNEGKEPIDLALWVLNGIRMEGLDIVNFVPDKAGAKTFAMPWITKGSRFNMAVQATGPWTASVATDEKHSTVVVSADAGEVETAYNWLGKFQGHTLCLGAGKQEVAPGGRYDFSYALLPLTGTPRVDFADRDVVVGIDLPGGDKLQAGGKLAVDLYLASPAARKVKYNLALTRKAGGKRTPIAEGTLALGPAAAKVSGEVALPEDGVYTVDVDLTADGLAPVHAERGISVGLTAESYRAPKPAIARAAFWSELLGVKPLPQRFYAATVVEDRPIVPWSVPAAGRKMKLVLASELDWSKGSLIEFARRSGAEWTLQTLLGVGTYGGGNYREADMQALEEKLDAMKPDCLFAAGMRFNALEQPVRNRILVRINQGMNLVLVGRDGKKGYRPWPPDFLKMPGMEPLTAPAWPELAAVVDHVGQDKSVGDVTLYRYGKGKIAIITRRLQFVRESLVPLMTPRNLLEPAEYIFAHDLKLMRAMGAPTTAATITKAEFAGSTAKVSCRADAETQATLVALCVTPDELVQQAVPLDVTLAKGESTVDLSLADVPPGEYAVSLWLLEALKDKAALDALRLTGTRMPAPVLDFHAAYWRNSRDIRLGGLRVKGTTTPFRAVRSASIDFTTPAGFDRKGCSVRVDVINGAPRRIAATRDVPLPAQGNRVEADGIDYRPIGDRALVIATVLRNGETLDRRSILFDPAPVREAPEDVVFGTSSGLHVASYTYRTMRDWAENDACLSLAGPTLMSRAAFPWKVNKDKTTTPALTDTAKFRENVTRFVTRQAQRGELCGGLADEFKIGDEIDYSEPTLQAFRKHLAETYGTVGALNKSWGSAFATFDEVKPVLMKEARKTPDAPARWLDFRLFIDGLVNRRYEIAHEEALKVSPDFKMGLSGSYEPGYLIGVNYYLMCKDVNYILTYPGLRYRWFLAFARPDAVIRIWRGYGGQRPRYAWGHTFDGANGVGWWGYMPYTGGDDFKTINEGDAVVSACIMPNVRYDIIAGVHREITAGLGKLFLLSKPMPARVLLPYSQTSAYVDNLIGVDYAKSVSAPLDQLDALQLPVSFVADMQILEGKADRPAAKLFVFSGTDAFAQGVADWYAARLQGGASILCDAFAGTRNEHGTRLAKGAFDGILGIDTGAVRPSMDKAAQPIRWAPEAPAALRELDASMLKAAEGFKVTDALTWAAFADGTPAVCARALKGGGTAVWCNTRLASGTPPLRPILSLLAEGASIAPEIGVERTVDFHQLTARRFDDTVLYGVIARHVPDTPVRLTLRGKAHTYDMRTGRYFGNVDAVDVVLKKDDESAALAQLPYRVMGIEAACAVAAGTLKISGSVKADWTIRGRHVVHCEIVPPGCDDAPLAWRWNVLAPRGRFELSVPLGVNDTDKTWHIRLRDAATGVAREDTVRLGKVADAK